MRHILQKYTIFLQKVTKFINNYFFLLINFFYMRKKPENTILQGQSGKQKKADAWVTRICLV